MLHHMLRAAAARAFNILDPYFQYVTMLLHGDGINGAQNNTFLDSSTNNFTITRNGNTTQGTFTPYGSNWSNYFDGTGDYLTIADNAALELSTSSFTMEWWSYPTTFASNQFQLSKCATSASTEGFLTYINTSGVLKFNANSVSAWDIANDQGTIALNLNAWNHCAISRSGSSWRMWVNGASSVTITSALGVQNTATAYSIGGAANGSAPFLGYMSNTRIVIGSYVYDPASSTLTIPTSPLTAITNTQLLTCQSNRFLDTSSNAFTITKNGDTSVQRFSPFSPTTAYSTSVIGGSGYFDGSGDVLTVADNAALQLGAGDFSIEFWMWKNSTYSISGSNFQSLVISPTGVANSYEIQTHGPSNTLALGIATVANIVSYATSNFVPSTFYHMVFTRSGNNFRMFVNGVLVSYATNTINFTSGNGTAIGGYSASRFWDGYITDVRIIKGSIPTTYQTSATSPPTSVFTPPTAPITTSSQGASSPALLLNMTNAGILDNAMMNDLETVGNAQISTSVKKYGTGSMYFDGTGDLLTFPNNTNWQSSVANSQGFNFGTGDFTVECWVYFNATTSFITIVGSRNYSNGASSTYGNWVLRAGTSNLYTSYSNSSTSKTISGTYSWSTGVWYHVAWVRYNGTVSVYRDGTSIGSVADSTSLTDGQYGITVGGNFDTAGTQGTIYNPLNGYIDDLRITKGVARYTANFTAPTAAFPNN